MADVKPKRSGANIPEAQRGTVQLKLRVPAATVAQLDALAEAGSRSEFVAALIDRAYRRGKSALG